MPWILCLLWSPFRQLVEASERVPAGHRARKISWHEPPTQGSKHNPRCTETWQWPSKLEISSKAFRRSHCQGEGVKWICLRGLSLLLWLSMTSKGKFAGELEGAGTLRKGQHVIVQILRARQENLRQEEKLRRQILENSMENADSFILFQNVNLKVNNGILQRQDMWFS